MIGDFCLTQTEFVEMLLFIGAVIIFIIVINRLFKSSVDAMILGGNNLFFAGKVIFFLAINYPLYQLQKYYQEQANSHFEPASRFLLALFFIIVSVAFLIKAMIQWSKYTRRPLLFVWGIQVIATLCYWAYNYLTIDCEYCSRGV